MRAALANTCKKKIVCFKLRSYVTTSNSIDNFLAKD